MLRAAGPSRRTTAWAARRMRSRERRGSGRWRLTPGIVRCTAHGLQPVRSEPARDEATEARGVAVEHLEVAGPVHEHRRDVRAGAEVRALLLEALAGEHRIARAEHE